MTELISDKLKELLLRREQLLKEKPELLDLQDQIDETLRKAGKNQTNRCVAINKLMLEKIMDLNTLNIDLIKDLEKLEKLKKELKA